ncbi:MAG: polysaccharide deacetylase family protein [Bacilli bacterium]|nr:polysaccharide deacetylase family protein [Bacilli bacterium]
MNNKRLAIIIIAVIIVIIGLYFLLRRDGSKRNNEVKDSIASSEIQVPVLIYHHFYSDDDKEKYEPNKNYSVKISSFESQMKYLYDNGYKSLTGEQMLCWKNKKCEIDKKSFLITIDDGQKSVLVYAKPILEKYGFSAISFIISSRMKETSEEYDASIYQYISKDELKQNGSIEWGSHSHQMHEMIGNQKKLYNMSYNQILEDVKMSKELLNTKYFAYPFNTYNHDFTNALREAGYELAFRGQSRKTTQSENCYMISRIFVSDDMSHFKEIFETNKYDQEVN